MSGNSRGAAKGWATRRAKEAEREAEKERRSAAAAKGWATRKAREQDRLDEWQFDMENEWIIEEPIDTVGGKYYE